MLKRANYCERRLRRTAASDFAPAHQANDERGMALIGVMLIMSLMLMLALAVTFTALSDKSITSNFKNLTSGFYAAEAGVSNLHRLLRNDKFVMGSLPDPPRISVGQPTLNPSAFITAAEKAFNTTESFPNNAAYKTKIKITDIQVPYSAGDNDPAHTGSRVKFVNPLYPRLGQVEPYSVSYQLESVERAIDWVLSMQCKNGGWASFDKDNDRMVFQYIPFADHNAMLDPPTVDITGRVLEMLAAYGYDKNHPAVKKALKFIRDEQEPDGSWFGRWGVNYIYGTMLVLRGLQAMGVDLHEPYVQQGAEWLRMVQNSDGGWGETCSSYDDPSIRGIGPSTPSQTAWAIMGLLAAGDTRSESVQRGILHLLETQRPDGSWDEKEYTGTGFPRVFYLAYHMYRDYFPLLALSTYSREFSELYREGSVGYARG